MKKLLAWWLGRNDHEDLSRLDTHTLKDIGLESWNGELAERLHAQRQRQILRILAARIGTY